ncbi:hypothetical protein [Streptosporangium sp. 'caverna']|uniref:hypothetical protein n=1 Tax=Streptosporangium sp. 'caverna' TaxID=2202249 RepID=UPI0013A69C25|nr:hypothetical protein [Streptosporangium sp. 'caverna']
MYLVAVSLTAGQLGEQTSAQVTADAGPANLGALDVAGASALARYRAELVAGRRARLIWREVKALGTSVLVRLLFPLWVTAAVAVIVALGDLGHYYQNGPAASWRKGARGERKTVRALAPLSAAVIGVEVVRGPQLGGHLMLQTRIRHPVKSLRGIQRHLRMSST